MQKKFIGRIFLNILQLTLVFMVVFGALVVFEYFQQKKDRKSQVSQVSLYQKNPSSKMVRVLGESATNKKEEHEGNQFVVQDITLGGETLMAMTADDKNKDIEISHLQGKLYRSSEDDDINYYASWQSNKPTMSVLRYKNEQEDEFQEIKETNYGYVHAITLPDIDFSSVYQYIIKSKDRWGNEFETGQFVFYTGAPEASFFELLEESFVDVFGWMKN